MGREDLVGEALSKLFSAGVVTREEMFIQTKSVSIARVSWNSADRDRFTSISGQDASQPLPYDRRLPIALQVKQSFEKSLSNLGLEYIDSVVLHSPLSTREVCFLSCRDIPRKAHIETANA